MFAFLYYYTCEYKTKTSHEKIDSAVYTNLYVQSKISKGEKSTTTAKDKASYTMIFTHTHLFPASTGSNGNNKTINCLQFHLTTMEYIYIYMYMQYITMYKY